MRISFNQSAARLTSGNHEVKIARVWTFGGILNGLWNFDVNNITSSIPQLLEGLKTAFITSIVGMVAGLAIKFINNSEKQKEAEENDPTLYFIQGWV